MEKGEIIREYRIKKGLTQLELADTLEISSNHLSLIENGKKGISNKLAKKIISYFQITGQEKDMLLEDTNIKFTKEELKQLKLREKKIKEREMEIANTYDFIRQNHFDLSKRAAINDMLIKYIGDTEKLMISLHFKLADENDKFLYQLIPVFKTTVKKIKKQLADLEEIIELDSKINIQATSGGQMEKNGNYLDEILARIPKKEIINMLTMQEKRMAILSYVAQNLKIKWKEYNVPGCSTGYSLRLWEGGRSTPTKKNYMENCIKNDLALHLGGASSEEEYQELLNEIVDNIITHSLVIVESAFRKARNAKTRAVRNRYLESMNNKKFLLAALQIGIVLYATVLKDSGVDIKHEYLSLRLDAMKENKTRLSKAWKVYNESEQTDSDYERLQLVLEDIFKEFEEKREMNEKQLNSIVEEKLILKVIGEKNLENYMYGMMDKVCQNILGKIRMFDISELE